MPDEKNILSFSIESVEKDILDWWEKNEIFKKLQEKNKDGKPFRFIDGPITANNPMGVHHAWGRGIKDMFLRYKAMTGHTCHYRNGFDTQGLWVEVEVEKELGFKDKKDIEEYGMANFTKKCVERIQKYSGIIKEQSKRLGQWMDWDNSYYTHIDENIQGIWHFLKVCSERGWLTTKQRPMPWCPRCGTSLSEHEMSGSHKEVTHTSVFVKAPVKGKDFDILVWTTTPWTLSSNVALAVNPELDYVTIKYAGSDRKLVLGKPALKYIDMDREVLEVFKGSELVGLEYETFFPQLSVQKDITHKVVAWEDVTAEDGSGVVHIAPGCGAEDFDLGERLDLPKICPVDDSGIFMEGFDFMSGKKASEVAPEVFAKLEETGKMFKTMEFTHSYPVCWRCKTEVLFRLVSEWYIKTDEVRPQLIAEAAKVKWEPEYIGKRMEDWLNNMGDWNISRKRFYGLPLPFYTCKECGHTTVVGSKQELKDLGGEGVDDLPELHRPWIDEITINCPHCGAKVSRIPEVGDVWLDAGIVPFSTLKYFSDKDYWNKYFPAEWVTEMREQVRLWFYSLLLMSVTLTGRAPYERVLSYSSVVKEDGTKFSKTGYMIKFDEAAEKVGADAIRYLYASASTSNDVRFGFNLCEEARRKLLGLFNIYVFFMTYAMIDAPDLSKAYEPTDTTDIWLISRINRFVESAKKCYEEYDTPDLIREFEQCVDDVSNWYIRINRRRFWKSEADDDKMSAYKSLFFALKTITQVMAPITPFMCEFIWQNCISAFDKTSEQSVHLSNFPTAGEVDESYIAEAETVRKIIALALKLRNEKQIKVKQPLSALYLTNVEPAAYERYASIIKDELNVKSIEHLSSFDGLKSYYLTLNFKTAGAALKGDVNKVKALLAEVAGEEMAALAQAVKDGNSINIPGYSAELAADLFTINEQPKENIAEIEENISVALDTTITEELKKEGIYREILRQCQVIRKEAGFNVSDRVTLCINSDSEFINGVIGEYQSSLTAETLSRLGGVPQGSFSKTIDVDGTQVIISIAPQEM